MENHTYVIGVSPLIRAPFINMTAEVRLNLTLAAGFLLAYVILGLVSFIWVFWSQRCRLSTFKKSMILFFTIQQDKLKGVQYMHTFLIPLFFTDVVTATTALILANKWFTGLPCSNCFIVFSFWSVARSCELILHLSNALVCILFLYNPELGIKWRFIASVLILLIAVGFLVLRQIAIILPGCTNLLLTLAIVVQCARTPPSPTAGHRSKEIAVVAILTFLFTSAPTWVLQFMIIDSDERDAFNYAYFRVYVTVLFGTNINLILDGLLCFFILKLPSEEDEEPEQQQNSLENTQSSLPSFHHVEGP